MVRSSSGSCTHTGGDELEHTADSIRELVGEEQFTLVAIQIDDWNRDLTVEIG